MQKGIPLQTTPTEMDYGAAKSWLRLTAPDAELFQFWTLYAPMYDPHCSWYFLRLMRLDAPNTVFTRKILPFATHEIRVSMVYDSFVYANLPPSMERPLFVSQSFYASDKLATAHMKQTIRRSLNGEFALNRVYEWEIAYGSMRTGPFTLVPVIRH
jgi:hypothetical protein